MGTNYQHQGHNNIALTSPLARNIKILIASLIVLSMITICNSAYLYNVQDISSANQVMTLQIMTALLLTAVSCLLAFNLYKRIEQPVVQLQKLASAKMNNFDVTFEHQYQDEFSHIAQAFKHQQPTVNNITPQSDQVNEQQVNEHSAQNRTLLRQLKLADITINCHELLFSEKPQLKSLEAIVAQLAKLIRIEDIDLCLMKDNGQAPYAQVSAIPNKPLSEDCISNTCSKCVSDKPFCARLPGKRQHKVPLINNEQNQIGVLIINLAMQSTDMQPWQKHCVHSIAAQLSKVLATINQTHTMDLHAPSA